MLFEEFVLLINVIFVIWNHILLLIVVEWEFKKKIFHQIHLNLLSNAICSKHKKIYLKKQGTQFDSLTLTFKKKVIYRIKKKWFLVAR